MRLSLMEGYTNANSTEVKTLKEVADLIVKTDWSAGIFKEGYRQASNFLGSDLMPIDIDEGMTINEAKEIFKDYAHIIATTRSHQKKKNGVIADRFRVVLVLSEPIDKEKNYVATYKHLCELFPCIDPSCSDGSRLYYKSVHIVSINESGRKIDPNVYQTELRESTTTDAITSHGRLSIEAYNFFTRGPESGPVNTQLYKACREAHQNGYNQEWVEERLKEMIANTGNWGTPYINKVDIKTIRSAFAKPPKHEPRTPGDDIPLKFMKLKDLKKQGEGIDWVVDKFLTDGGISLIAGEPKAGKSTLARQLALSISRGDEFLGRLTQKTKVLYMALEEQVEIIDEQFTAQGLVEEDDVYIHSGPIGMDNPIQYIRDIVSSDEIKFLIIDTLALLLNVENLNSYSEVNRAITPYRNLARETNTHIMFVHHANKNREASRASKIMGSTALFGAVDNAIIFERGNPTRFITSFQRGGEAFTNNPLKYNEKTLTYSLMEVNRNNDF